MQHRTLINLSGLRSLPLVLQSETAECGLACIAMVCGRFGRREDLATLRARFDTGARGTTLNDILRVAEALGFTCRALRCEVAELGTLSLPAILHWDFNHYVVLRSVTRRAIIVHDPACGIRSVSLSEAGAHFTGIAVEFMPVSVSNAAPRRRAGLWHYLGRPARFASSLTQILLLSAVVQCIALVTPFYLQIVVDDVLVKRDYDLLWVLSAGFAGLSLFSVLTRAVRGWAGIYLSNQLSFDLAARLFHHLMSLPAGFFMKRRMGDLVSRFSSLKPIQEFLANSTITIVLDGVMAMTTLSVMCLYSAPLAGLVVALLALTLVARVAFYSPLKQRTLESIAAEARADSNFMESIRCIGAVKRFSAETLRCNDWQNRLADTVNARVRLGRISLGLDLLQGGLAGIGNVAVVLLGARAVLAGHLSIGMLYAFLAWRGHLTDAINSLSNTLVKYLMLSLHLDRLADIGEAAAESIEAGGAGEAVAGRLTLSGGAFRYSARAPWIFRNFDLAIPAGTSVAILGPSGSGKSTLLAVMMGMLPLDEGQLRIDGRAAGPSRLRLSCASVMQDDCLLAGSIRSNITFGDAAPDPAKMHRAARIAAVHDIVAGLPMGYETPVGEMGATLSAGQVQRILIARAIYREPAIMFLDEGTAHLDREAEMEMMRRLLAMDMTCIFATHRGAVAAMATRVIVTGDASFRVGTPRPSQTGRRMRSVAGPSVSAVKPSAS